MSSLFFNDLSAAGAAQFKVGLMFTCLPFVLFRAIQGVMLS